MCGQVAPVNGFICHKQIGKTEEDGRGGKGREGENKKRHRHRHGRERIQISNIEIKCENKDDTHIITSTYS